MAVTAVMHLIDGLGSGGAERVVVNLVNALPRERYRPILCTSRFDGPLAAGVRGDVPRVNLGRRGRFDLSSIRRLAKELRDREVDIVHAHSTSLFLALAARFLRPETRIVWHDHYGPPAGLRRNPKVYGPAARRADAVVTVSEVLVEWTCRKLRVPSRRVQYIPNFLPEIEKGGEAAELPGTQGSRIACVAGIRAEKDFKTLMEALEIVAASHSEAHLIVVGPAKDQRYWAEIQEQIANRNIGSRVTWLGERQDVHAILAGCDIGVLSSASEGFPMALLEYGWASLGVVSTDAGQSSEILDHGAAGIVVRTGDSGALAQAILRLLKPSGERKRLGELLRRRVQDAFSERTVVSQIGDLYASLLCARRN